MIVGLTGGIGSGKSTVAGRLIEHGIEVINADQISRDVVEPGQPALANISEYFGPQVLTANGEMDRAWLRQQIFSHPDDKQWLEQLLHPLIAEETVNRLNSATSAYCVLESPLLIEMGQDSWCDRVLVIDVPEEIQISRGMARDGNSRGQIENIIAAQASRQQRCERADDVILNDASLEALIAATDKLHQRYLEIASI